MNKILIIIPECIVGSLIMEGLANGFESNKCRVLRKRIGELTLQVIEELKPDIILGYNYSFLTNKTCTNIIKNSSCKNLVFYFADNPQKNLTLSEKNYLFKELKSLKAKIFISDKDFKNDFKKGIYLPLAVNPKKYITNFSGYKYTISFVGSPLSNIRQSILCELIKTFKNKLNIFSIEEDFLQSVKEIKEKNLLDDNDLVTYKNCWRGFVEKEKDLAEIYNSSKINLNITMQGKSSVNYHVYEVLASGGFLLTDERADLKKYFEISKNLETYKDTNDLIDKINFYLKNLNIAQKIAYSGKFEVIRNHTFSKRVRTILQSCL